MARLRVAVIMGGGGSEHDVSLATGREAIRNLNKAKYQTFPLTVSPKDDNWLAYFMNLKKKEKIDLCFLALHGSFGEDGTIQGMLDFLGIAYTGSGVLASALGMNKIFFKKLMVAEGLTVPKSICVSNKEKFTLKKIYNLGASWVVKPACQGSSVGVSIVLDKKDLKNSLKKAFSYDKQAIIEEYLLGKEVSCAVLGNDSPYALPVIEICPKGKFFDYWAKYIPGECKEIVPARLSKKTTSQVQKLAVEVYKAVGCRGYGRVDMIIKEKKPYILEINTLPGLTPTSLLPQEAKAAGINYSQLLDLIIGYALVN
ncbi:MAG: D-alanine--D-alanine ligase [Candidatus Shapirobacteria bacterium]